MALYPKLILDALTNVKYPGNGKNIVDLGMVEDDIRIDGNKVSFSLIFDRPTDPFIKSVVRAAEATLPVFANPDIDVKGRINVKYRQQNPEPKPQKLLPGVSNIIGVSSGKGGVGKSTVAANLAIALAAKGFKVGLLDADIFGPSMPKMFGVEDAKLFMVNQQGQDWIEPVEKYGVKMLSIGFVVDKDSPVLWRGGMASNALKQLISEAWWGELDYFLIDMPPGTSDIHLTLVQTLPITGVIVVSTPQEVALADARKGIGMFRSEKINVPILGLVENMAWFTPAPHPEEKYYIFGKEGAMRLADQLNVPLLAQIPLVADICETADSGHPTAVQLTGGDASANPEAKAFADLAERVIGECELRNVSLPPTQVVQTH